MPFIELQSVDSTNNYARSLISEGLAQHGTAIFAYEQRAGKGQRGRQWLSEKGSNLILSILIKPEPLTTARQFELSVCAAVCLHHLFNKYAGGNCSIKWPNDLYWQDRKAGGILIESVIRGQGATALWDWAILGIGVNINQTSFPEEIKNAVSLKQIRGRESDPVALAREYCENWDTYFGELVKNGFDPLFNKYQEILYRKNQVSKFKLGNRIFDATIKAVTHDGKLVLQHSITEEFSFGEIELLAPAP